MANERYYDQFNREKYEKFNEILDGLPYFCNEYFTGIDMRTSVLTKLNYATDLAIFFDFLVHKVRGFIGKQVVDITLKDLDEYITVTEIEYFLRYLSYYSFNGKPYRNGEKAKARKLSAVRSLFKYFYNKDKLKENVTAKVATPKLHEKPIIRLDDYEVEKMLDTVEAEGKFVSKFQNSYNLNTRDRDIAIVTLFLGTGIRVSELVGISVEDLDLPNRAFKITRKGGNMSVLYFSGEVQDALEVYLDWREQRLLKADLLDKENALFISLQNKRITVRAVENLVKKYTGVVNPLKSVSPHKLRSTYGTALYRQTKDIYMVAEVLGHRDVNTTKKHYAAMDEDIKREASTKVVLRKNDGFVE
ncbi:MAG: tyrosine-type recombinase/integrase [Clostridia bacterium]|nr:tyrosine-type recombinase/integrase [Clostridia bacterium]